jgi:predicted DNA-binding transcriptional regulator AlpA
MGVREVDRLAGRCVRIDRVRSSPIQAAQLLHFALEAVIVTARECAEPMLEGLRMLGELLYPQLVGDLRANAQRLLRLSVVVRHDIPRLLRRVQVADLLGVSPRTLDRIVRAGELPVVRIDRMPRFCPEDVRALIRSRRTQ